MIKKRDASKKHPLSYIIPSDLDNVLSFNYDLPPIHGRGKVIN